MRKINFSEDKEKKQKRNHLIFGIILVGLMVLSVLGYGFGGRENSEDEGSESVEYRGREFVNYGGVWASETEPQIVLGNNPLEIPTGFFGVNKLGNYAGKPLYISYKDNLTGFFIYDNFRTSALRIQEACFSEPCSEELPMKNCSDNLIVFELGEEGVMQEGNCVFISGSEENISRVVDSFVLEVLGAK